VGDKALVVHTQVVSMEVKNMVGNSSSMTNEDELTFFFGGGCRY
jgi:hypothetical protein